MKPYKVVSQHTYHHAASAREDQMSLTAMQSSSKLTNAGVAFVAISILIGMIFSADMYGIIAGILMLILVAFEYFNGPVGA
jgi:hypothetical protein